MISTTRFRRALLLAAALLATALAGCGGGGGSKGTSPFGHAGNDDDGASGQLPSADSLAQRCATPRASSETDPFTGRPYGDKPGSLSDEKKFLLSFIDETYLWYQDVRALPAAALDPGGYPTPTDFFAALKTPLLTASGKPKDRFHFTYDTPTWVSLALSGTSYGYGFQVSLVSRMVPRNAVVAFTDPNTPASEQSIARGAQILAVDGVDLVNGSDTATLNAGLFPTAAGTHTFDIRDAGSTTTRTVMLTAKSITSTPVQNVQVLPAPNQQVGYLLFNDHIATAEPLLKSAIESLKAANVTDLVVDLRYNGGGFLDIAAEFAYMIAGPANTNGKFFERQTYNDKNPFGQTTDQATTNFLSTTTGISGGLPDNTALPTLGLNRVYVLTTADTCSASEAIINGLRGAGVTVKTIGSTTCGKPYGFYPQENCGTTYFAIQFKGVNNMGEGDYADGLAPDCPAADDYTKPLGDPAEDQLEVALALRNTGTCVAPGSTKLRSLAKASAADEARTGPVLVRNPLRENRFVRPR